MVAAEVGDGRTFLSAVVGRRRAARGRVLLNPADSTALVMAPVTKGGIQSAIVLLKSIPGLASQPLTSGGHV